MNNVWTRYHVYVFQSRSSSLDTSDHHFGIPTISKKISKDGTAMICPTIFIFWISDVFLTKTNHHERVFQYRTFQTRGRSFAKNLRKTTSMTRGWNSMTSISSSRRYQSLQPRKSISANMVGIWSIMIFGTIGTLWISSLDCLQILRGREKI
jgi:hypothetical protein